jgi:predicted DNA-binding WGR domain protein
MYEVSKWGFWRWQSSTRYYTVEIVEDLFGTWILRSSWGGLSTRKGNSQDRAMSSYEEAMTKLKDIDKRRRSRRYAPVSTIS